jgi:hypothetical protein
MFSRLSLIVALSALLSAANAFAPIQPMAIEVSVANLQQVPIMEQASSASLQGGVREYLTAASPMESSSFAVSLKDRPPPPTAEEIAAKKANFNFWFWGGGFVAPFVATVYYFGPKFWTK